MIVLRVNGERREVDVDPATPLLWVIREQLKLTGTKFGCGIAQCGACTVHLDGQPVRSCVTPVSAAGDRTITTIEGIRRDDGALHPVQAAWIAEQVPQCGYCQSGQIMAAVALLRDSPAPTDADIDRAMNGHICRCGTYGRIRRAIHRAAGAVQHFDPSAPVGATAGRDAGTAASRSRPAVAPTAAATSGASSVEVTHG